MRSDHRTAADVRADNVVKLKDNAVKIAAIVGGGILLRDLIRHRRAIFAMGVLGTGAALAYHWLGDSVGNKSNHPRPLSGVGSPSYPGEHQVRSSQEPKDQIDEAMMESFPASDAPASYRRA